MRSFASRSDMAVIIAFLFLISLGIWWYCFFSYKKSARLPPGPFSWPIVGSLLSLRLPLHCHFAELSKKYGPIIYLKVGMVPFLVVNDSKMAEQVLKVHDLEFASRPRTEFLRILSLDWNDVACSPSSEQWRRMRKISNIHLFCNPALNESASYRARELKRILACILQACKEGQPVNLRSVFQEFVSNPLCFTLFGKQYPEIVKLVDSITSQGLNLNVGELIPALDWLDLHGAYKQLNKFVLSLKALIDREIEEHRQRAAQATGEFRCRDFIDALISLGEDEISDVSIVGLLIDMVAAGHDTTISMLESAMAEIIKNPQVELKAQEEIDSVVGRNRIVNEDDLQNLPYIQAIVKEVLRLHPVVPLGSPHYNSNEVNLDGYRIPAGCKVLVNIWAIGRDKAYWIDADVFKPERFLESNINVTGQHFQLIPFSAGRRICAGFPLVMRTIPLVIAALLQAFDWSPVGDINMEASKMTMTSKRLSDLVVAATPRKGVNYAFI